MFKIYLKETLTYVIDHFSLESKRHFDLSLTLMVMLSVAVLVFGFLFILAGSLAFGLSKPFDIGQFLEEALLNKALVAEWVALAHSVGILFFGLYGSFVISTINDDRLNTKTKYTMRDFRAFISSDEWQSFFILLLVLFVFHFLTFKSLVSWFHYDRGGFYAFAQLDTKSQIIKGLLSWMDSVILLIRIYLPYLFAVFFIITVYGRRLNKETLMEYKWAIITAMFLGFCTETLSNVFISYVDWYLIGLLRTLMASSAMMLFPAAIKLCTYIGLAAYFNWGISATLCLPIKLHSEQEVADEEALDVELPH